MSHWTFEPFYPTNDLRQGDILRPGGELKALFDQVHPHFSQEKYLAFVVITQTCDLAIRSDGECSAKYINLAAVRSLRSVFEGLLATVAKPIYDGVFLDKDKQRAHDMLARIFNQNEQKLGLFYLAPDADIEIGEDAVAFLRVSVAFRSEHYSMIKAARCGRLKDEFANKLGWLVGNLYSRVPTKDWDDDLLRRKIDAFVRQAEELTWVAEPVLKHIRAGNEGMPKDQFLEALNDKPAIKTPFDLGLERVSVLLQEVFPDAIPEQIKKLERKLKSDQVFKAGFRQG